MGKASRQQHRQRIQEKKRQRRQENRRAVADASPHRAHERLPSPVLQEGSGLSLEGLRYGLSQIARERNEWAGIPLPMDGHPLIIEPSYPNAAGLMKIGLAQSEKNEELEPDIRIRNVFWSSSKRSDIYVYEQDGKITWGLKPGIHNLDMQLSTLGASDAWSLETEQMALETLETLIEHRQLRQYLLTGSFLEGSRRSGVHYIFRKLRPTVAIAEDRKGGMRILASLCLHPIAYYAGSWAGAMSPTDDVIAHLMLMRGDEHMFWRRANQHGAYRPEAGI